jgi:hypothetical protein
MLPGNGELRLPTSGPNPGNRDDSLLGLAVRVIKHQAR